MSTPQRRARIKAIREEAKRIARLGGNIQNEYKGLEAEHFRYAFYTEKDIMEIEKNNILLEEIQNAQTLEELKECITKIAVMLFGGE